MLHELPYNVLCVCYINNAITAEPPSSVYVLLYFDDVLIYINVGYKKYRYKGVYCNVHKGTYEISVSMYKSTVATTAVAVRLNSSAAAEETYCLQSCHPLKSSQLMVFMLTLVCFCG